MSKLINVPSQCAHRIEYRNCTHIMRVLKGENMCLNPDKFPTNCPLPDGCITPKTVEELIALGKKEAILNGIYPWSKDTEVEREVRSLAKTDECPNYNICEKCRNKYYHNRTYHLSTEKLLCPNCLPLIDPDTKL